MIRSGLFFLLLLAFFATFSPAQATPPSTEQIANFQQVDPGLYRGGRPSAADLAYLAGLGVKTDLNLQGGDLDNYGLSTLMAWWEPGETAANIAAESTAAEAANLAFVHQPLNSLAAITPEEDQRIDQILQTMNDPNARPVFLHCEHGADRTGMLVALYRVKFQGWAPALAYQEWMSSGHGAQLHQTFTGQLDTYFQTKVATFTASMPAL